MAITDKNKRVVYANADESIVILIPSYEYLQNHTIEELAAKDVPSGHTYYIIDISDVPTDRTFRGAWVWE